MNRSVASAAVACVITGLAVVYVVGSVMTGWEPSSGWLIQAIIHVGELSAVVALAWSGAAGRGRPARVGLAAAVIGQVVLAAAEVIWPRNADLGDVLFGVAPILTGLGLVVAGVAAVLARVWAGPSRYLPLALGGYTLVVLIPVMIGSGGPPAPLALWVIGGWDVLWFALGAVVLRGARAAAPVATATARVTVR